MTFIRELQSHEIDTLIEYIENFVRDIVITETSHLEVNSQNLNKSRLYLREYMEELIGEKK